MVGGVSASTTPAGNGSLLALGTFTADRLAEEVIPTLSEWGIGILIGLLALGGAVLIGHGVA